jgi:uncharacterized protein GlcG (DUF336 family)
MWSTTAADACGQARSGRDHARSPTVEKEADVHLKTFVVAAVFAGAVPFTVDGQILTERNISLPLALSIANAAMAACKADGYDVSAAVVDRAGDLKVLLRADTANPHNADLARRKAYTSRTFKVPSMEVAKRTNGPTDLSGQRFLVDIIPLGGGVPINVGNDTIGALGISGSPTQDADEKCANAALASVAGSLR